MTVATIAVATGAAALHAQGAVPPASVPGASAQSPTTPSPGAGATPPQSGQGAPPPVSTPQTTGPARGEMAGPVGQPTTAGRRTIIDRVLVRVNGEILTQSELTQRQIDALREQNRDQQRQRSDAELQAELAKLTPDILVTAVDELLLVQRGREMGVRFTDEQFNQAIENIKKDNKLDDAKLKAALAQEGLTIEQLRQNLERSYLVRAVQQREIGPSMTITQEEQRQYYDKNKERFMTPATVTVRELLVTIPARTVNGKEVINPADEAAAKAKIDELHARMQKGEDFQELVTSSSDSATKANGGLIGPVNVADLNPTLKELLDTLQPGQVTAPIRAGRGFQIFKLESRAVPELRPFDSVRADIEQAIRDERLDPETEKMLARLRTNAVIEWKDDMFKQLYERRVNADAGQQ
jgi:peptidyl-prolyl cis-trans isomerase SurA